MFYLLPKCSFFLPHPSHRKLISFQYQHKHTYIPSSKPSNPLIYWPFLVSRATVSTCPVCADIILSIILSYCIISSLFRKFNIYMKLIAQLHYIITLGILLYFMYGRQMVDIVDRYTIYFHCIFLCYYLIL